MPTLETSVKGIGRPGLWIIDGELLAGRCMLITERTRFVARGIAAAIVFVLETHRDEDGGEMGEWVGMEEMRKKGGRWRTTPILELQKHPTEHMLRRSTLQFQTAAANHVPPYWGHCFDKSHWLSIAAVRTTPLGKAVLCQQRVQLAIAWPGQSVSEAKYVPSDPSEEGVHRNR